MNNVLDAPNINHLWSSLIVEELIRCGVQHFCISPGSRSTPLTMAAAHNPQAKCFVHFDERGSGFLALGLSNSTRIPCAIITTSGTALANLFPAVIEASKKKQPLIILTADRPPELRFTGANQTIDQVKIFGDYARWFFDMPCPSRDMPPETVLTTIDQAVFKSKGELPGPVHLNCMFRAPLEPAKQDGSFKTYLKSINGWIKKDAPYTTYVKVEQKLARNTVKDIARKLKEVKQGVIVVGKLGSNEERRNVLKLAEQLNWPIFPDISSGMRLGAKHNNIIPYYDQIFLSNKLRKQLNIDGVLHLGGRITSKRWYDFSQDADFKHYIMVLNHPLRNDPMHNVSTRVQCRVKVLCEAVQKLCSQRTEKPYLSTLRALSACVGDDLNQQFNASTSLSELSAARCISQWAPKASALFISNSLPIREMDMYADARHHFLDIGTNRGASGIDGIIASAVGYSIGLNKRVTLLIGDLAALYDVNSLALLKTLQRPMTIVVLNNDGGGIFSVLPIAEHKDIFEPYFGTPHGLMFENATAMFGLQYECPGTIQDFVKHYQGALKSDRSTVIEVKTDRERNADLIRSIDQTMTASINQHFSSLKTSYKE